MRNKWNFRTLSCYTRFNYRKTRFMKLSVSSSFKSRYALNPIFKQFSWCKLAFRTLLKNVFAVSRVRSIDNTSYTFLHVMRLFMKSGYSGDLYKKMFSFFYTNFVNSGLEQSYSFNFCDIRGQPILSDYTLTVLDRIVFLWNIGDSALQTKPTIQVESLLASLSLTYSIKYQALGKKMRKIIKNKYRFTKKYQYLYTWNRLRSGLRLLKLASRLYTNARWFINFSQMFLAFAHNQFTSPVYKLWYIYQSTALRSLSLR